MSSQKGEKGPFTEILGKRSRQALEHATDVLFSRRIVEITDPTSGPLTVYYMGDIHYGSDSTNYRLLAKTLKEIHENPNARVVLVGDEIEGSNPDFTDTNMTRVVMPAHKQIQELIKVLSPIAEQKKIWCIVDNYSGHNGWGRKKALLEPTALIADGLDILDRIIQNGGHLIVDLGRGKKHTERIWHNAGGGSSDKNPIGHLRNRFNEGPKLGEPDYSDSGVAGHHHRRAATRIVRKDLRSGRDVVTNFITTGTYKFSEPGLPPDLHRIADGKGTYDAPGVVQIISPRRVHTDLPASFLIDRPDNRHFLQKAILLWDNLSRLNETDIVLTNALKSSQDSSPVFHPQSSRDSAGTKGIRTSQETLYKTLDYRLPPSPITIGLVANGRWGSGTTPQEPIIECLNYFNQVNRRVIVLGNMLEKNVPNRPDRGEILRELLESLKSFDKHMLGIMLGSEFRDQRWAKSIAGSAPIRPSQEMKRYLKTTPLITHESLFEFTDSRGVWSLMTLDGSNQAGSNQSPFLGQENARRDSNRICDVVVGTRSSIVGFQMTPRGINIGIGFPGGVYAEQGKVNYRETGAGGQSITKIPGITMPIPAATFAETKDIFTASQIAFFYNKTGKLDNIIKKTSQRTRRLRK